MKIFLLEDELSQQIRVEKHIAEIAKELEIKLEVISTIDGFKDYKDVNNRIGNEIKTTTDSSEVIVK